MMGAGGKAETMSQAIRPAGLGDLDAVRRIARATYAIYVARIRL